jgi:hypothetical protein
MYKYRFLLAVSFLHSLTLFGYTERKGDITVTVHDYSQQHGHFLQIFLQNVKCE